jgi:hypothetical protein
MTAKLLSTKKFNMRSTANKLLRKIRGNSTNNCYFLKSLFLLGAAIVINCPGCQNTLATSMVVPWKKNKDNKEKRGMKKETKKVETLKLFFPALTLLAFS